MRFVTTAAAAGLQAETSEPTVQRAAKPNTKDKVAVISRLQQSKLFREYQRAFEATTGLPLVLRAAGSFQTPLYGSKRINPFCALMTQKNKTCSACLQLQQHAEEAAALGPKTLQCYAGLYESAIPVRVGNKILGYLQTGQVFLGPPALEQFKRTILGLSAGDEILDAQALVAAYVQTRVITRSQYESIIRLLSIFAEHLAAISNQMLISETTAESPVLTKTRTFIAQHQSDDLSLGEIARAMNMSAFYFCKFFKKETGLSFTEYLARARIESVKQLLLNTHTHISEAGFAAGFQSLSQFNRVFHRVAGESPSSYRLRQQGSSGKATHQPSLFHSA
jgi:AraC-like DNA-binding protein